MQPTDKMDELDQLKSAITEEGLKNMYEVSLLTPTESGLKIGEIKRFDTLKEAQEFFNKHSKFEDLFLDSTRFKYWVVERYDAQKLHRDNNRDRFL